MRWKCLILVAIAVPGRKNNFVISCFVLSQLSGNECQMSEQFIAVQCIKKLKHSGMVKLGEKPYFVLLEYI